MSDRLLEFLDVGSGAEAGFAPDLFSQCCGEAFLQLLDAELSPQAMPKARLSLDRGRSGKSQ
ncbi:hypothetical protein ACWC6I_21235 [Streptomyces sp. NPDC001414]